jgi:flagellar motility protein MotE (MotC chaperone)
MRAAFATAAALAGACWLSVAVPATAAEDPVPADPAVARLLSELQSRRTQLERKEKELGQRERSVESLEASVTLRLAELERLQGDLEKRVAEWKAHEDQQVPKLAKTYGLMPAERAAQLLEQLEPDLATRILARMKQKNSAAVLAVMSRGHALLLTERMARPMAVSAGGPR